MQATKGSQSVAARDPDPDARLMDSISSRALEEGHRRMKPRIFIFLVILASSHASIPPAANHRVGDVNSRMGTRGGSTGVGRRGQQSCGSGGGGGSREWEGLTLALRGGEGEEGAVGPEFVFATEFVRQFNLDSPDKMVLYKYYKQGTVGKCNKPKPSPFDWVEKAKWQHWSSLGDMSMAEVR